MNRKCLFNDHWAFAKSALDVVDSDGLSFYPVDIPYDWLVYDTSQLYENSIGWYRKRFTVTTLSERMLVGFDGVYMNCSVFVNQQWVGDWKYGYSSFEFDMTDALVLGENEIRVKVVHQSPNSRWYSGAGIYRNVWLKTRSENYLLTDGIYLTARQGANGWQVDIESDVHLCDALVLSHTLTSLNETVAATSSRLIPLCDPNDLGF